MKGEGRGEEKEKVQKGLSSFECPRRFAGNFASVLLALGEKSKRQPSVNTLLYWLFGMKKKGLYSSEGYNQCFLALRDAERGGKCKEKTTHNLAPVGIRQKFSWAMGPLPCGRKASDPSPGGQGAEERYGIIEPCVPKGVRSPNFIYIFL